MRIAKNPGFLILMSKHVLLIMKKIHSCLKRNYSKMDLENKYQSSIWNHFLLFSFKLSDPKFSKLKIEHNTEF